MFPPLVRFARDATGAVAPLFAVGLIAFVGVGALAWDISRGYALRAELEAAVDAAALAGATQLDGTTGSIARATTAAQGALVQNSSRLADTYRANAILTGTGGDSIRFLTNLTDPRTGTPDATGTALTVTDSKASFIEITLAPRPMGLVLGGLLGRTTFNARAHAVAGYGSALCKVPPMMICNPDESVTFDGDDLTGKALVLTPAPNAGTFAEGNFGFLTVNSSNSAALIRDGLGRHPPKTECYGQTVEPAGGNITSADAFINMRFDIYRNGPAANLKNNAAEAPNYPPAMNTIIGLKRAAGSSCNIADSDLKLPSNDCSTTAAMAGGMGLPRDCNQTTGLGSGTWNMARYFATNHSGIDLSTFTPANKDGTSEGWAYYGPDPAVGQFKPTRYQVYKWELAILAGDIAKPAGAFSDHQDEATGTYDFAKPRCNTAGAQTAPDRRTISVIVMNCEADNVKAQHAGPVRGYVDLFLIGPVKDMQLYAEVIEATEDTSAVGEETRFYTVRLYE